MFSNVYITIQSNQVHELLSFFVALAGLLFIGRVHLYFHSKTLATTLYLYMWLKCYVFDIV